MSIKEVLEKLDRLEQQIQLILKDNVALYLQNQELQKELDETKEIARRADRNSAGSQIIGGPRR